MIPALFYGLRTALAAKGVPAEILYGPTQVPPAVGATRIQFLRDPSGDGQLPVRGAHRNPRHVATRASGCLVRIFARDTTEGATRAEHEDLADRIVDQVHSEIHKLVGAARAQWRITKQGFVDVASTDGWAGALYEFGFQVERGVADVMWPPGGAASEFTMLAKTTVTAIDTSDSPGGSSELPGATTRIES